MKNRLIQARNNKRKSKYMTSLKKIERANVREGGIGALAVICTVRIDAKECPFEPLILI